MPTGGAKYTILVVDDDEDVREIASAILEEFGYATIATSSGAAALQVLATGKAQPIDVLFTDIMMPGMNGFELAQQAAAIRPDLKIILTSGYIAPEMAKAMSSVWTTVPKPWRPAQLAAMMAEVLDGSGS